MSQGQKETRGPLDYAAYLLRLWRERGEEMTEWRASLQDPHTGEKMGFAGLEDLVAFLEEETGSNLPGSRDQAEEGGGERSGPEVKG